MPSAIAAAWSEPSPFLARLYIFAAGVLWSLGGLFIKEIEAGAMSIVFFRCFFSALLLFAFVRGRTLPRLTDGAISIVLFAALLIPFVASTKETTAANAIFLQYTAPLWVIAFGPLILSERLNRRDGPPMAIALGGIAILFIGNWSSGDIGGMALGALSGVGFGLMFLWLRRMFYADAVAITFVNCVGVAIITVAFASVWKIDAESLGLIALMAVVQFATPYVLITKGLAHVRSSEATLIALVEPVLNPVWVALFFGEAPSTATVIGGGVILGGLALRYTVLRDPQEEPLLEPVEAAEGHIMDAGPAPSEEDPGSR
ncbi:MAG TPA: DMT family transporter [Dehalococcoidia bacterium]|nr:DMT family transporter [Dehalococcoidia bacterium]